MSVGSFRADYDGEYIVTRTDFVNGVKQQTREWVDNPIQNQHISGRAAVVGSLIDRHVFDPALLQNHRGGLFGSKRLQTYGAYDVHEALQCDFYLENEIPAIEQLIKTLYTRNSIVYSTLRNVLKYPGQLYNIPFNPLLDIVPTLTYLASFDGHQEIFLLGCHNNGDPEGIRWNKHMASVFEHYPGTRYCFVGSRGQVDPLWRNFTNFEIVDVNYFVSHCDIG